MIVGEVRAGNEAVIRVSIFDSRRVQTEIEVVIDTGFSGSLTLPATKIALLGLEFLYSTLAELADGNEIWMGVYHSTIMWDGQERIISVYEAEGEPLVGMSLLKGFHLGIDVIDGGSVAIDKLP